jgi:modulator of FtsH protease HflK
LENGLSTKLDPAELLSKLGDVPRAAVVAAVVALALLLAAVTSVYTVQPEERAVVTRFGRLVDVRGPGLQFKLPFGIEAATRVPTARILKQEFGFRSASTGSDRAEYEQSPAHLAEALMLTGDLNVVEVQWVVQYQVADPVAYLHQIGDPERTIRDVSESVMRRIVGNRLLSDVLSGQGRVGISGNARDEIGRILGEYGVGISIRTVELQDVVPPAAVRPSYNAVNEAQQERERLINEAEKRRNQEIPRARGEAQQLLNEAEGYRAERVNRARGDASRFTAVAVEYRQAPEITRRRLYLETLDEVLPKAAQVLVVEPGSASPIPLLNMGRPLPAPAAAPGGAE